jgi:RNA polymerase sigma-70 factor (ECF subfamily)
LVIKVTAGAHLPGEGSASRATVVTSFPSTGSVPRCLPAGARSRLDGMVRAHLDGLWRFLRRLGLRDDEVDDALQEVIVIAATRLEDIRRESEQSFLFGTAYRVASGWRRKHARRREVPDDELGELPDPSLHPDEMSDRARARALLDRLLNGMPIELRAVLVLYEIEEHTMAEIAALLDLPAGTVASRLRRARADFEARVERAREMRGES